MARHTITLDRRTLFGKNMFNFLVGMKYVDIDNPDVADVDERTYEGKRIMHILYYFGIVKSPYKPDFVEKIKKSEQQIANGKFVRVTNVKEYIDGL